MTAIPTTAPSLVTLSDIQAAADRIRDLVVRTPLLPCAWAEAGRPLWLKPESLQATGAFKLRGASNALALLDAGQRARGVVAQSSGNHAQAVAYAAARLGIRATIVMPDTTPAVKLEATRGYGAEILIVPPAERDVRPLELVAEHGYAHVPPYDDARIIAGQGTVGLEIAEDLGADHSAAGEGDLVLVPVSGGGLISGVATAIKALSPTTRVIAVEPELAADAAESFRTGRRVTWTPEQTYRTIADGLRTTSVGVLPFAHIREYVDGVVTVSDEEIASAVRVLGRKARLVAEPSGAVTTAAYLYHAAELPPAARTVAVVSGGNVDPAKYLEYFGGA
ncbi:threonine ammonia-lyase [Cryptosporangium phraense]|uniref:threonine ammonia-lyase n=1 Tax=Cryptosporangium phraense TaxID=2593070 RepID=A0A545AEK3_9ACTN|nr:threonine/serine dehydratase [Cryptosporangium phraense]TQS39752.1 threonine/serine dehydratase [Cryptosporangium phraense]